MRVASLLMDGQHAGAVNSAGLERLQRVIRLIEGESLRAGPDWNRRGFTQEIESVLAGIGSDASDYPFSEEITIIFEWWNGAHMDSCERQRPASFKGPQGRNHQFTGGSEHD